MTVLEVESSTIGREYQRIIGRYKGAQAGPTLICVGGIHGNEPLGICGLNRVFEVLAERTPEFCGEFVGLAGNLAALLRGVRYIHDDLNRMWIPEVVRRIHSSPRSELTAPEDIELHELMTELEKVFECARGEVIFIDLHTFSAPGQPFVLIGDTLRNRAFAFRFPVPVVLGLEEQIDGTLLEHLNSMGHITLGFEGGQHEDEKSIDNHEAAIWNALVSVGCIKPGQIPEAAAARGRLAAAADHLPDVVEIRYRCVVEPNDEFVMQPGYSNFDHVKENEALARNSEGDITADERGLILLPLYQGLGDDGFFLGREIKPIWLKISAFLRRLHAHNCVPWLPGVHHYPHRQNAFIVNRKAAGLLGLRIFRFLGFRKIRHIKGQVVVTRRLYDLRGPDGHDGE